MHGQALRSGWLDDEDGARVVQILITHAESEDARIALAASDELLKLRALDLKLREIELKERIADDKQRLALLGKLASVDPAKLAQRARALGIVVDGRTGLASCVDGGETQQATRPEDAMPGQPTATN